MRAYSPATRIAAAATVAALVLAPVAASADDQHTVRPGETLSGIASRNHTTVRALADSSKRPLSEPPDFAQRQRDRVGRRAVDLEWAVLEESRFSRKGGDLASEELDESSAVHLRRSTLGAEILGNRQQNRLALLGADKDVADELPSAS